MSVQAQYPSNVFHLNRNEQEMNNTIDNDLFSQSQMYFNNGGGEGNTRKRVRETSFGVGNNRGIDLFSLQPQPHHTTLINLSELHNQPQPPPKLVSTGLHLATQQQQQEQSKQSTLLSDEITVQLKQQSSEMDQFLQVQGDYLRRTLAERRQSHYHSLLTAISESESGKRLREKETEMQKAIKRNTELEQRAAQVRGETQVWQNKARKQEAIAASLQRQLQQAIMSLGAQNNHTPGEDEVVGCSGAEDAESAHVDPERVSCESTRMSCKACRKRVASVVLLPCRHLCLCTNCNGEVDTCPVCFVYRSASLEVYLS